MKKTYIIVSSSLLILVSIVFLGTYSYFVQRGAGSGLGNTTEGNTATLKNLVLAGGTSIKSSTMIPGESVIYNYTVKNENNMDVCYGLYWGNVTNEFSIKQDLVYTITDSNENKIVNAKIFPSTGSNEKIYQNQKILKNKTETYTLTVTYQNPEYNQNTDMDKSFSGSLNIELTEC